MPTISKRMKAIYAQVEANKFYAIEQALDLLKQVSQASKFNETVEIAANLGVDPRKSDQTVRGSVVLPHGTGRNTTVAVFAQGSQAELAKKAGADIVGFTDLAEEIKAGKINFNVLIATPDAMRIVGTLGQILGPKGLMPNPKVGTVTADVEMAVKNAKAGQVQFRTDKNAIIHCPIGKVSFSTAKLRANLEALILELKKLKPSTAKGIYIKRLTLSSTMGPGLAIDQSSINV